MIKLTIPDRESLINAIKSDIEDSILSSDYSTFERIIENLPKIFPDELKDSNIIYIEDNAYATIINAAQEGTIDNYDVIAGRFSKIPVLTEQSFVVQKSSEDATVLKNETVINKAVPYYTDNIDSIIEDVQDYLNSYK